MNFDNNMFKTITNDKRSRNAQSTGRLNDHAKTEKEVNSKNKPKKEKNYLQTVQSKFSQFSTFKPKANALLVSKIVESFQTKKVFNKLSKTI